MPEPIVTPTTPEGTPTIPPVTGAPGTTPQPQQQIFTIKVNDQQRSLTIDELKEAASKAMGADARFEEAAKVRKENEKATRLYQLMQDLKNNPDPAKATEVLGLIGVTPEEIQAMETTPTVAPQNAIQPGANVGVQTTPRKVSLQDLDPQLQQHIQTVSDVEVANARKNIEESVNNSLDTDAVLGKIVLSRPEGSPERETIRSVLYDMTIDEVQRRILCGGEFGPLMVKDALQKVRANVDRIGIPARAVGYPGLGGLGPNPSLGYQPITTSTEPIQRVGINDPKYHATANNRLQQMLNMAAMGLRKKGR